MILQLLHGPICPNKAMIKVSVTLGSRLPTYLKIEKKCNTQYTSFITKPHWKKIFKLSDEIYLFQRICFIKIQMVCWARERDLKFPQGRIHYQQCIPVDPLKHVVCNYCIIGWLKCKQVSLASKIRTSKASTCTSISNLTSSYQSIS